MANNSCMYFRRIALLLPLHYVWIMWRNKRFKKVRVSLNANLTMHLYIAHLNCAQSDIYGLQASICSTAFFLVYNFLFQDILSMNILPYHYAMNEFRSDCLYPNTDVHVYPGASILGSWGVANPQILGRGLVGVVDGSWNIIISYRVQEMCWKEVTFEEK